MRKTTSRAALSAVVLGLTIAVIGALLTAGPASARKPAAPGNFRGYGFDTCVAPSQSTMDIWNLNSPYSVVGIYISGRSRYCGDAYQPNLSKSWVIRNAANGWRFLPIHVGYQAPCFQNNKKSRVQKNRMSTKISTARRQAVSDAHEAILAARKYGFDKKSVLYLDIEWYDRNNKACDAATLQFADAWTKHLHKAGYKSGLYSSGSAAIASMDAQRLRADRSYSLPDHMWNAWSNHKADTRAEPYMSDAGWARHKRIHQYHLDVSVRYGGVALNIDKNFLDVGAGTVAKKEPLPCGVRMSFQKYSTLRVGDRGAKVRTLQCLLRGRGFTKSVNGVFTKSTLNALNRFRRSKGWGATAHVTRPTWVALLAEGRQPRVLKYGSVGSDVWRLQRALTAATGKKQTIDGKYQKGTTKAVKVYRRANKLANYSTAEAQVWRLLNSGRRA